MELTDRLEDFARFNKSGALTQGSKNQIRRRLAAAGRQNKRSPAGLEVEQKQSEHLDHLEEAAAALFLLFLFGKKGVDSDAAREARERLAGAKMARARAKAATRNRKLAESLRMQHLDQTADAVIGALEASAPTPEDRSKPVALAVAVGLAVFAARKASREISRRTRARADRIAAFESDTINTEFTRRYHVKAGITSYKWITMEDDRVREEHEKRHGRVFLWSHAHDDGHPGEPPNCRCVAAPVLPLITKIAGAGAILSLARPDLPAAEPEP